MTDEKVEEVLAVTLNGKTIAIQDLPLEVIGDISRETNLSHIVWWDFPLSHAGVTLAIIRHAATYLGEEPPKRITMRNVMDYFTTVPDDVPPYEAPSNDEEVDSPLDGSA